MFNYAISFFSGSLVKMVDWIEDEKNGVYPIKWPLALIAGVALGFLIHQSTFASLFLGTIVAQVMAGKIDKKTHLLTIVTAFLWLGLGVIDLNYWHLAIFAFAAFLDELKLPGKLNYLSNYRLFLKLVSFTFIFFGRSDYFLAIILFDAGYALCISILRTFK